MKKNKYIIQSIRIFLKIIPSSTASRQFMKPRGLFGRYVMWKLFEIGNARLLNFMVSLSRHKKNDHVLDIGFGPGNLFHTLMKLVPEGKVYGIDFSMDMVGRAEKKYRDSIDSGMLELKCSSIEEIPYGNGYFNAVYTANTIYFWPDPEKNIREVHRVLKRKGKLFIGYRTEDQLKQMNVDRSVFRIYSDKEIASLMDKAGFKNIEIMHKKEKEFDSYCASGTK